MTDSNAHRAGKRNFQAFLTPDESKAVDKAKKRHKVSTDRQLVVKLTKAP